MGGEGGDGEHGGHQGHHPPNKEVETKEDPAGRLAGDVFSFAMFFSVPPSLELHNGCSTSMHSCFKCNY